MAVSSDPLPASAVTVVVREDGLPKQRTPRNTKGQTAGVSAVCTDTNVHVKASAEFEHSGSVRVQSSARGSFHQGSNLLQYGGVQVYGDSFSEFS